MAGSPAPVEDRFDTNNKQQHTMVAGNSNNIGGFQHLPVNTYMGNCSGNAEDEALLAKMCTISMKLSSNCFASNNNDVRESNVDIATGNVIIKSLSGRNYDSFAPSAMKSTELPR